MDNRLFHAGRRYEKLHMNNEVNDPIPHEVDSEQDVDDLLAAICTQGLDVIEGQGLHHHASIEQRLEEAAEDIDLNPSRGAQEVDNDPEWSKNWNALKRRDVRLL